MKRGLTSKQTNTPDFDRTRSGASFGGKLFLSLALATAILGFGMPAQAQKSQDKSDRIPGSVGFTEEELEKSVPPARPEDVASPEAIVKALHESVSGPKGDWNPDRLRSLCLPNVFFGFKEKNENGVPLLSSISIDNIVQTFAKVHRESSWYERADHLSVVTIVKEDGHSLASVTYAGEEGTEPDYKLKVKPSSITDVMYIGKRWWIVSHLW